MRSSIRLSKGPNRLTSMSLRSDDGVKEKVRRCVKQAHIDPEDFKGVRQPDTAVFDASS